jgi:hypothetical protein
MAIDGRRRVSCGSDDWHTAQAHAISGTPWDVPLPRTVTRAAADPARPPAPFRTGRSVKG